MKTLPLLLSILIMPTPSLATDLAHLADAIAEVETGNRDDVIGAGGERSRYQLSEAVWRQHRPGLPFRLADEPREARRVALEHLRWLVRHSGDLSAYELALRWNAGLAAVWRGQDEERHRDFARRVASLYHDQ